MSRWTHAICWRCWEEREPGREPQRITDGDETMDNCCFCREATPAGIYVRADPAETICGGDHKEEEA